MAAGAETNFFGVPGMREHGWPLYTLPDAIRLHRHLLSALEQATAGALTAMAREGPGLPSPSGSRS